MTDMEFIRAGQFFKGIALSFIVCVVYIAVFLFGLFYLGIEVLPKGWIHMWWGFPLSMSLIIIGIVGIALTFNVLDFIKRKYFIRWVG